ncbi:MULTISPECIES: substrate-binding domain-containing protein [unclassified Agarivorans]|uniref:substrate-binding domain-containing protein n=1 Tax=unclassified Agarivorans TaxID=2636026 RepID=UPI0026E22274|nr:MULTISPECIES: substrate-binding domain-containing protein [unclassified Agarivorans]MDO6687844.1 substrate-binding domain-containing protein [Agarivorans sp. 3_MG-2023]MDO6717466.1 substrate-binding domain-containing protein [Agarivorans sp. 2_MG-2023]
MQEPDIELLNRFVNAYEQRHHFPETSSPSSRKKVFAALEQSLSCKLFDGDYSNLNSQGQLLYQRAKQLQLQLDNFLQSPLEKPQPQQIIIGLDEFVPSQSLLHYYPRFISELSLQQLKLVQLSGAQLQQQLCAGEIDIALRVAQQQKPPKTHSRRYCNLNLALACAARHSLSKHQQLCAEQLQRHRQLCLNHLPIELQLNRVNCWQLAHREMLHDLLVLGMGWAFAPRHWLESSFRNGSLIELHLSNYFSPTKLEIEILWLNSQHDSQVAQCLNLLGLSAYDG